MQVTRRGFLKALVAAPLVAAAAPTVYRHTLGLTVRDWRYVVRVANINVDRLAVSSFRGGKRALLEHYAELARARGDVVYFAREVVGGPWKGADEWQLRLLQRVVDRGS